MRLHAPKRPRGEAFSSRWLPGPSSTTTTWPWPATLRLEIPCPCPLVSKEAGNLDAMFYLSDPKHCMV